MFQITRKILLNHIRKPKYLLFEMMFPIFLMMLIGAILTNSFYTGEKKSKLQVFYLDQGNEETKKVLEAVKSKEKDFGIELKHIDSKEKGKIQARVNKNVFVHLDNEKIKIYSNEKRISDGAKAMGIFKGVANANNAITEMYKINPSKVNEILQGESNELKIPIEEIDKFNPMTSYDYYGVVDITMMMIYAINFPLGDLIFDRRNHIKDRFKITGLRNFEYYMGSMIAYLIISIIVILPSFLFSSFMLGTKWGNNPLLSFGFIQLFCLSSISLGMAIAVKGKSYNKAQDILSYILPVFSFLGGAYVPLEDTVGGIFGLLTNVSPLRWINRGLFRYIYSNDCSIMIASAVVSIIVMIIMFIITLNSARKEDLTL